AATFVGHEHRARGEARRIAALAAALPAGVPLCRVPAQDVDVHDLRGLAAMAAAFDRPGS
ncbi:MAG: hypothetical protein KC464_21320, partial [Myxococcales bacterium]|nr:hypothetical protein [Myxococcales bacterium]